MQTNVQARVGQADLLCAPERRRLVERHAGGAGGQQLVAVCTVSLSSCRTMKRTLSPGAATTSDRVPAISTPASNQLPGLSVKTN